jgi:hypothetical protein
VAAIAISITHITYLRRKTAKRRPNATAITPRVRPSVPTTTRMKGANMDFTVETRSNPTTRIRSPSLLDAAIDFVCFEFRLSK